MNFLQLLSSLAGLISFGATVIGAFFLIKNGVGKSTNEAQESAINAMKSELDTLRGRIEDTEKENAGLKQTIQTICEALKLRGLVITIQGEMVNIQDSNGSTTTRIRGNKLKDAH